MSRGLGRLQREILAALDADHEANFVSYDGRPVYDMLAVKETLAARGPGRICRLYVPELQAIYRWRSGAFEASFSRAIHTLVQRGILRREFGWSIDWYHTHFVSVSVKSR
jgi:hypothetical protein